MPRSSIVAVSVIVFACAAQARLPNPAPAFSPAHTRVLAINRDFERSVTALRDKYLARRAASGGVLTAADRDAMQRRYDALVADYRRKVRNENPWSVDASGHAGRDFAAGPPIRAGIAPVYSN